MRRLAATMMLGLVACGGQGGAAGESPNPNALRLCVRNETVGYGNLVARAELVRFNVQPGQELCRPVSVTGAALELRAQTTGGGSAGPLSYAERLQPGAQGCWRWRLSNSPASAVDLTPCEDDGR